MRSKFKKTKIGFVPVDWSIRSLSDIIEIIGGGTPRTAKKEYWNGNISWISVSDFVNDSRWIHHTEKTITQKGLDESSATLLSEGHLIISARGTVGKIGQISRAMAFNQTCYGLNGKNEIENDFLYYLLRYKIKEFQSQAHGSVFDTITRETFKHIFIPLPDILEQKSITKILSDLDSKIELNQKMNKILEQIAQTVFKSWFVDYEFPDENGKPYRSSGGEMIYSEELGKEIPKWWSSSTIKREFSLIMGQSPPGKSYNSAGNGTIFFQGRTDFGSKFPSIRMFCTEPTRLAKKDDVLISVRAPVGDANVALHDCCIGRGLSALIHKSGDSSYTYYFMINLKPMFDNFEADGTVFGAITKGSFEQIRILSPSLKTLNLFKQKINPIDNKIKYNHLESLTLSSIRDFLLPKLISGKIRVN